MGALPGASRSLEFVKAALCVAAKAGTEATGMKLKLPKCCISFRRMGEKGVSGDIGAGMRSESREGGKRCWPTQTKHDG